MKEARRVEDASLPAMQPEALCAYWDNPFQLTFTPRLKPDSS
jgi:hypothetical protein